MEKQIKITGSGGLKHSKRRGRRHNLRKADFSKEVLGSGGLRPSKRGGRKLILDTQVAAAPPAAPVIPVVVAAAAPPPAPAVPVVVMAAAPPAPPAVPVVVAAADQDVWRPYLQLNVNVTYEQRLGVTAALWRMLDLLESQGVRMVGELSPVHNLDQDKAMITRYSTAGLLSNINMMGEDELRGLLAVYFIQ